VENTPTPKRRKDALDFLLELKPNWDSYGAPAIDPRAIVAARAFLGEPIPVPTVNGGVELVWEWQNLELEVEFAADGQITSVFVQHNGWEIATDDPPLN
jgi:hypothetical protein